MIAKVEFTPATFEGKNDDARNVRTTMKLRLELDRRGIQDLIAALVSTIADGCGGCSHPSFDGTINIVRTDA